MAFQILSLSGGGFLGLYTATLLAELERHIGKPIVSCFDLMAGTSVGGIIALGLAAECPPDKIKSAFESNGSRIFSNRPAPRSHLREWIDFFRSLFSSKYDGKALRRTIIELLGEKTRIGDLKHPVVVPAVNLTKGMPQVFKTAHHPDFKRDHELFVVDVALATSAAPSYFPIAEVGDELFVDGGLYANSPDLIALHEAEYFFKMPTDEVRILSVGTTTARFSFSHVGRRDLGVFGWGRRLPQTMLSSQQLDVGFIVSHKLRDRYLRIDEVQSKEQERDLGLDVANEQAAKTVRGLASGSFQKVLNNPILIEMLEHRAPEPRFFHTHSNTRQ